MKLNTFFIALTFLGSPLFAETSDGELSFHRMGCSNPAPSTLTQKICADPKLIELNNEMAGQYDLWEKSFKSSETEGGYAMLDRLIEDQIRWESQLILCHEDDLTCLESAFLHRIEKLQQPVVSVIDTSMEKEEENGQATSSVEMRLFDYWQPYYVRSVNVEKQLLQSPLSIIQNEISAAQSIGTPAINDCAEGAFCFNNTTLTHVEVTKDMWIIRSEDYDFFGGAYGTSTSRVFWLDVENEHKFHFSDMFEEGNLKALQELLQKELLAAIRRVEESENHEVAYSDVESIIKSIPMVAWDDFEIIPARAEDGKLTNFLFSANDGLLGPHVVTGLFLKMPVPVEPFLPLMKPEFQSLFAYENK